MSRALITGASGFIGTHLIEALVERGDEVTCFVRGADHALRLSLRGMRTLLGNLTDPEALAAAVADCDVVYHLAGLVKVLRTEELFRVNEGGVQSIAAACAACETPPVLVLLSSMSATGPAPPGRPRIETDSSAPVSHYGRSKRAGELAAEAFAHAVPITVLRPALVFGEHDANGLEIFRPVARFGWHMIAGFANREISCIHAADLAQMLILAAERGRRLAPRNTGDCDQSQGYYFAASDERLKYAELGRRIGAALGRRKTRAIYVPRSFARIAAAVSELAERRRGRATIFNRDKIREALAGAWACSTERAKTELAFAPAASLDERLRQTVRWYRRQGWL